MNRRVHLKEFLLVAGCLAGIYVLYSLNTAVHVQCPALQTSEVAKKIQNAEPDISPLSCFLNREVSRNVGLRAVKKIDCLRDGDEVYVPFTFVKNYFELIGSFVGDQNEKEFEISYSSSRVVPPSEPYSSGGQFMHFSSMDVEGRSRVLCVSAAEGVPLSTQWDPHGYFYPTQIAQFALSHYSRWVLNREKGKGDRYTVQLENQSDSAWKARDEEKNDLVIQFKNTLLFETHTDNHVLSLDLKISGGVSTGLRVVLETADNQQYTLSYTQSNKHIQTKDKMFVFGFGAKADNNWLRITRDLHNDLKKGLQFINNKVHLKSLKRSPLTVVSLTFFGSGKVANISLSEAEDLTMFVAGADWFIKNQDEKGGWPSNVVFNPRRKKYPQAEEIPAGWYGAMCQGQAISVLCRAYHATEDKVYLKAANDALEPFNIDSKDGGVRASFLGVHTWYEEYPTSPPTFILNGFMYALLGLYDLFTTDPANTVAKNLFDKGMESLESLLPFYDSGSATFYDLRHFTMKTSPKIARWDYHTTHINQLLLLASIHNHSSKQLMETAERWRGYMVGKKASHN